MMLELDSFEVDLPSGSPKNERPLCVPGECPCGGITGCGDPRLDREPSRSSAWCLWLKKRGIAFDLTRNGEKDDVDVTLLL